MLAPDDGRNCYYLDSDKSKYVYSHDYYYDDESNIIFVSTDLRVEYVNSTDRKIREFDSDCWNNQLDILEVFTHEWLLNVDNQKKSEEFFSWAANNAYSFGFIEEYFNR